ncbi:fumarate/nitrate reduction transcriptional regulator Fnr [Thiothrix litoralis]|jgi:CRP/FNR family transcriptional regulator|uniref:Fumarate/nitrate reduction transcriptional regulator Fnr n=1 Tax=Thiothrix litoralis TaxID=2891210 RepID=A0ABX7WZP6_9GAMM|nr:fumarate/nitrate reduction transcriptional regulator Fnr [Thiothrix litoralis]QTR47983.1 fumarate/nitrate reduction transcriptional regulator Fnr [Thiothrix litoralis]
MKTVPLHSAKKSAIACHNCSLSDLCLPRGLNRDELELLENSINKTVKIKKKDYLFHRDDTQQAIFAVKAGAIKTSLSTPDGEEQILGFYLPGDLLGFDAFARDRHTCDAQALDDTLVCELSMDNFQDLCGKLPIMRGQMMRQIGTEIEREQMLLLTLGQMRTEERLATFLSSLSERNQERGFSPAEFNLPMARHDLANYLGMAVETLSRMFSRLQEEKIIAVQHRLVKIDDMNRLKQLAHHTCRPASDVL